MKALVVLALAAGLAACKPDAFVGYFTDADGHPVRVHKAKNGYCYGRGKLPLDTPALRAHGCRAVDPDAPK